MSKQKIPPAPFQRITSPEYVDRSERFRMQVRVSTFHFNKNLTKKSRTEILKTNMLNVYSQRLKMMKPWLQKRAIELWGGMKVCFVEIKLMMVETLDQIPICKKLPNAQNGTLCILAGTLFKEMPLVPRVLDEYAKEVLFFLQHLLILTRQSDLLFQSLHAIVMSVTKYSILEDEEGRTQLVGEEILKIDTVVTGKLLRNHNF